MDVELTIGLSMEEGTAEVYGGNMVWYPSIS